MADDKQRKEPQFASNAPNITDPKDRGKDKDLQDQIEEALIEAEETIRRETGKPKEADIVSSNAPNITNTPGEDDDD